MKRQMIHSGMIFLAGFYTLQAFAGGVSGGVSGGGGNTLPLNPSTQKEIKEILDTRRFELVLFFNALEIQQRSFQSSGACPSVICQKLFDGPRTIQDVVRTAVIDISTHQACTAPDGTKNDGAAPGSVPDSVCMSTFTIPSKVEKMLARAQTLALLAHEFSHLVGTSEDEAQTIQSAAAAAFFSNRVNEIDAALEKAARGMQTAIESTLPSIEKKVAQWRPVPGIPLPSMVASELTDIQESLYRVSGVTTDLYDHQLSVLSWSLYGRYLEASYRISALDYQLTSSSGDGHSQENQRLWGNDTELPILQFLCRQFNLSLSGPIDAPCSPPWYTVRTDAVVHRATNTQILADEVRAIAQLTLAISDDVKRTAQLKNKDSSL